MAKAQFGEFAAYDTPGGIRFQKNNKLVSQKAIPPEVVDYLTKKLTPSPVEAQTQAAAEPKFPLPSPEEQARLKEESMQVPPELQRTPEEMAAKEAEEAQPPLAADDFEDEAPLPPMEEVTATSPIDPDFMESVSIHTASLEDIAQALYERFGIYTVYLNQLPRTDEINPLTGVAFTKYHLGIAYQAAIYAQNQGILRRDPEAQRKAIDTNRAAAQNIRESFDPIPRTPEQMQAADSFGHRTSVQGTRKVVRTRIVHEPDENGVLRAVRREIPEEELNVRTGDLNGAKLRMANDSISDEPLVEPNIRGGKGSVIRPNW